MHLSKYVRRAALKWKISEITMATVMCSNVVFTQLIFVGADFLILDFSTTGPWTDCGGEAEYKLDDGQVGQI